MNRLWPLLLPELRAFPHEERDGALRAAHDTALDVVELVGMAAGLVAVTALTRYGLPAGEPSMRYVAMLMNFAAAVPLLALALGPLHLRRLRRGLREQLLQRPRGGT
jgi:hypothetical protein